VTADEQLIARWYRIDAAGRIVDVDPDWDRFALSNGGERATRAHVLGRPLADFLTGDITRMYLETALEAARLTGKPRTLPYRCDAPQRRRALEMTLEPLPGGDIIVRHRLLHSEARPPRGPALRYGPPQQAACYRCSQCLRLLAGTPARGAGPASGSADLVVADTVCGRCLGQAMRADAA
jgi:hypothetical protein